jgi:hypothetical protein
MRFYLNITDDSPYNGFFDNTFCVLGFLLILISAFLAFSSLGAGSGKQTRKLLGANQETFLIAMKENTAVAIYNQITFPVLEIRHQLDLFTSMHHFINCVVSLLSFICSLLRSKKQEESSPKIRELFLTRETKKFLRWRTSSTSIEYGRNNDRTTAST